MQNSVLFYGLGADGKRCCDIFIVGCRTGNGREEAGMFAFIL